MIKQEIGYELKKVIYRPNTVELMLNWTGRFSEKPRNFKK